MINMLHKLQGYSSLDQTLNGIMMISARLNKRNANLNATGDLVDSQWIGRYSLTNVDMLNLLSTPLNVHIIRE